MDYLKLISSKLKENPGAIFGILYPYVLVVSVIFGLYYLSKLDFITKQNIPAVVPDTTVIKDLQIVPARTIPSIDIKDVTEPNTDLLEAGKNLFVTMCASCHGEDGEGGGPGAAALNPPPRNFVSEESWINGRTLSGIYTTLQEGIPGTGMIPYDILTPKDKFSLAHYIRKQFIVNPPQVSNDEISALDQLYNLSAGVSLPAQIPVANAINIIEKENNEKVEKVEDALGKIRNSSSAGATLFFKVTDDQFKALSTLVISNGWNDEYSFKNFLTGNLITNGFNGQIFSLTDNEWFTLFSYLKNII